MAKRTKRTRKDTERVAVAKTFKMFVGGAFVRSESGHTLACTDAAGAHVANVARASRKDLRDAVVAARAALPGWAKRSAFNRGQIVFRIAEMLEDRRSMVEARLVDVVGLDADGAEAEVSAAIDRAFWYAGWCDKFAQVLGGVNPVASPFFDFTLPEPIGVVCAVTSRRSPLVGLVTAIASAIATGNTCVVVCEPKHALVAVDFTEVLATSDVPGGVVNVLTGRRDELVPHIGSHFGIDAVAWYGAADASFATLERLAAESVKRVRRLDDRGAASWRRDHGRSLAWLERHVEWKTAWHPIGT